MSDEPPPPPPPPPQQQKQPLPKTSTVTPPAAPKAWAPGAPASANKPTVAEGAKPTTVGAKLPASVAKTETAAKPVTTATKPATAAKRVEVAVAKPAAAAAVTQPATTSAAARVPLFTPRSAAQTPRETPRSASRETPRSAVQTPRSAVKLNASRSAVQLNTSRSAVQLSAAREPRATPSLTSKSTCGVQAWTKGTSAPTPSPRPAARGKSMGAAPALSASQLSNIGGGDKPPLTSEDRELQAAKEHIGAAQKLNAQRRAQLDKVLSTVPSQLPKRSTASLTMPADFALSTARSDPGTPTGPGLKPVAEQVRDFSKTPRRFRTRAPGAPPSPMPARTDPKGFTRSTSFDLSTTARATARGPTTVKSTAQREVDEMASMPKFTAQPLNRRVLESAGDLGVPRVQRPAPTKFEEFHLSQSNLSQSMSRASLGSTASDSDGARKGTTFKARPYNKQLMEGKACGLGQVTPRKATCPKSPGRGLANARAPPAEPPAEEFVAFRARPMPTFSPSLVSPRPQSADAHRPTTSPRPFSLRGAERRAVDEQARARAAAATLVSEGMSEGLEAVAPCTPGSSPCVSRRDPGPNPNPHLQPDPHQVREQRLKEAHEKEVSDRTFHARQMPVGEAWKPEPAAKPATAAAPFHLFSEERGAQHESARSAHLVEAERSEREQREFHARSAEVLKKHAFTAAKSTKPLTEINGFRISSTEQAAKRKAAELDKAAERAAQMRVEREEATLRRREEAAQLKEHRRSLVHKSRSADVLKKEPFKPQLSARRPTQAQSPHWAPTKSRAVRA